MHDSQWESDHPAYVLFDCGSGACFDNLADGSHRCSRHRAVVCCDKGSVDIKDCPAVVCTS